MAIVREIDDKDYVECLNGYYKAFYERWKTRMTKEVDDIVFDLSRMSLEDVKAKRRLTNRDIALLVRLKYFTAEEVECYDLEKINQSVPYT